MNVAAIPTEYKGLLFRSRLEAQWAHFFDSLCWAWEYEPFDLDGYIPDFVLKFASPLLVEVKPCLVKIEFDQHFAKIERAKWDDEVLIVGATLFPTPSWGYVEGTVIGKMWQRQYHWTSAGWYDASIAPCNECGTFSPVPSQGDVWCRVCGANSDKGSLFTPDNDLILDLWYQAKNATQWAGPRGRR